MTRLPVAMLSVFALLASGCGSSSSSDRDATSPPAGAATERSTSTADRQGQRAAQRGCTLARAGRGPELEPRAARTLLDRAVARATRSPGPFTTSLSLRSGSLRGTAMLRGHRTARTSTARLDWTGPAALVLPDATLRIAGDRLYVRTSRDTRQRDIGSASGVALDVGRELLDHPFLLDVREARGTRGDLQLRLDAPAARVRAYATSERRGPVTELLRGMRSLVLDVRIIDGQLRLDRFTLRARVPDAIPQLAPLAGRDVTLAGLTRRPPC